MFVDDSELILAVPVTAKSGNDFMLAVPAKETLQKSFVEAHYRHGPKGQLIFVQGYHNKKYAKPEDLTASKISAPHKNADPTNDPHQKTLSFHKGDEVFVKYSHMHDQHFLLGAVLSIRDDNSHGGKLIAVRLLNGRVEYYRPNSLVHVSKEGAEERKHEVSNYKDDNNDTIDYKHLNPEQKQFFYDQYKLWFRLHRMGELKAFNDNKQMFAASNGKLPANKDDLTAEQKIQLEKLNKFPVVPLDAIREMVSQDGYDKGKHAAIAKQLLEDISTLEKQGVPSVQFPKLYKKKGKKEHSYAPPEWMAGMFPSVEEEIDASTKEYDKIMDELHKKLGDLTPSTEGKTYGDMKDFSYGQPIIHGAVKPSSEEGSKYKPAPQLPPAELSTKDEFWQEIAKDTVTTKPTVKESENVYVPKDEKKSAQEEKALFHQDSDDISDLDFKVVDNAANKGFGGTHSKYLLEDAAGNQYLFKPYKTEEVYRTWVDVIAHKVAKSVGIKTADFGSKPVSIKIPSGLGGSYSGKKAIGSVQKVITNIKSNNIGEYASQGFTNAPKNVIEQLQREHVIDWLMGNNDAHKDQFLIDSNGNLIGIDKGHCFKYYKDDVLSLTYDPANNNNIGNTSVYHTLLNSAKSKKLQLSYKPVKDFINGELKNLNPTDFANMVLPYAQNSVLWKDNPKGLQDLAISRLASIEKDFNKLYKSVGIDTGFVAEAATQNDPNLSQYQHQEGAFQQIDSHFHQKVMTAKGLGCSIMMGGGSVEDMSVLFTPYKWDFETSNPNHSGKGMEVSFKLMSGAEQDILKMFDTTADSDTTLTNKKGTLEHTFDPLNTAAVAAAKTVNHHSPQSGGDNKPDATKMNNFAQQFQGLPKFDPNAPLLSVEQIAHNLSDKYIKSEFFEDHLSLSHDVATHYHQIATDIINAAKGGTKTPSKQYEAWSGNYTSKTTNVSKTKTPHATYPSFEMDAEGNLTRKPGDKQASFTSGSASNYGAVFKKQLDGNITVSYYPHYSSDLSGQNNLRSQQGNFIIDFHNWDGDISSMHKAREVMHKFGVDHKLSNHADLECLYLTRIAWQNKANLEHKADYEKIQKMENNEKKIQALKELCEKSYGAPADKLSSYHPLPKWDDNSGHHYFLNPYVMEHLKNDTKPEKMYLKHDFQATKDASGLKSIARNGLMSVERRRHLGFDYFGMSTTQDQRSGGASYVFLRGLKPHKDPLSHAHHALVFRPELWARTDLIPRKNDQYGTTHDVSHDHGQIHDRVKIMDVMKNEGGDQYGTNMYNDVTLKNGLSMSNWLIGIKGDDNLANPSTTGKVYNTWINKFKKYILKYKPHVMNHAKFENIG